MNFELSIVEKKELLKIARNSMETAVKGESYHLPKIRSEVLKTQAGAFVTLKKRNDLRGCIGLIQAMYPLYETVSQMAVEAALRDPRFSPVTVEELSKIEVEISVLTPPVQIKNIDEIEVGKHGLIIENGFNRGLLLPQVATEYNWDRDTFLEHTCLKAGLPETSYQDAETKIYTFSAIVFNEGMIRDSSARGTEL